ncbi:MAG: diaminopimelate epimerase, partial [Prolixibacteraceae bacterium]|nr:diaminopimelate epimerase [Prolixibacteraceae bacterium]
MIYKFYKYQGAGNDFIIIDNRENIFVKSNNKLIEFLCHRRFGIGADGLMTLELSDDFDFRMTYFNSDGFEASMCGNGGRCIVAFANHLGIIGGRTKFLAADGSHDAFLDDKLVDLHMIDVNEINSLTDGYFLNTGVPHLVHFVDDLHVID